MARLIQGVGVCDADYTIAPRVNGKRVICPYYRAWTSMLNRCYTSKFHERQPTYIGATVCDEWLNSFMAFRAWMMDQSWEGKQLDKDLLVPNNKHYSPSTCMFVSRELNSLLTDSGAKRGDYKIGVSWHKDRNKFQSHIKINGKKKHLGYFTDELATHRCYVAAKFDLIHHIAQTNPYGDCPEALEALYSHADALVLEYESICNDVRLIDHALHTFL